MSYKIKKNIIKERYREAAFTAEQNLKVGEKRGIYFYVIFETELTLLTCGLLYF